MNQESNIQHKPAIHGESDFAFERGQRVPIVEPEIDRQEDDAESVQDSSVREIQLTTQRALLALLLDGNADAKEAGLRAHLLAFGLRIHPAQTQMELAVRLQTNQSTISRCIKKSCESSNKFAAFWGSLA